MKLRKMHLENVRENWKLGDLSKTLNALVINKDTSAVMDFFNSTFAGTDGSEEMVKGNLAMVKLTNWGAILSHLYTLFNTKFETYIIWACNSLQNVFPVICSIISKSLDDIKHGIDAPGEVKIEEKRRRVTVLFNSLKKIVNSEGITRGRMRDIKSGKLLREVIPDIELFLEKFEGKS